MWAAVASVVGVIVKFFLFGWLTAYLHKKAGKKEAQLEGRIDVAEKEKKQHETLANSSSAIADANDFADRVRDSGF